MIRHLIATLTIVTALCAAPAAMAQDKRPSHCIAIADAAPGIKYLHKASLHTPVEKYEVRLSYLSHASFLIQTHSGTSAVTDYTGYIGVADFVPDVVTMNHAHGSHWTAHPHPDIPHVLKGWGEDFGAGVSHYLDLGDMIVRNVSTDIRSAFGGREDNGNSIFVFEVDGMCVGHLGHLHHEPDEEQYAALGRLDIVMAPVDGGMTVPLPVMINVLKRLRSSVVIPMHWFSLYGLDAFLDGMKDDFAIDRRDSASAAFSLATLPSQPTVVVLQPRWTPEVD